MLLFLISALMSQGLSEIDSIRIDQVPDGSGLVKVCYRAINSMDSIMAVNVQARWRDSTEWHIPVVTLFDTISAYSSDKNIGWRVGCNAAGREHCFIWDMSTDIGSVDAVDFLARIVTFDSLVSSFNVIDSFRVKDTLRAEVRAFGLAYKHGQLWVLYHNEITHDCWVRPYDLPSFTERDSIYIGTVTIGPSDMAFAGDRLFWVEDTRLLLKEFDFSTGTSHTLRGDWWGIEGTSEHIAGAAFDGSNLWVCFSRGTFIALDTSDFSLVDTLFFPEFAELSPETSADGLAWGLELLWCFSNDNIVYAIDVEMDSIIHEVPTGHVVEVTGAEGAAWDGTHLWVVDYARGYVYKLLLYGQIKEYHSSSFDLDNVEPWVEWNRPALPDFADTFRTLDTVSLWWSVIESNPSSGNAVLSLMGDTIADLSLMDTIYNWSVLSWPDFHGNFNLSVMDSFGNKANYDSPIFYIDYPEGITEGVHSPSAMGISIEPNPFNSACRIQLPYIGDKWEVEIFDLNGKLVEKTRSSNGFIWRPINSLSGIYLVRARSGNTFLSDRLIILK